MKTQLNSSNNFKKVSTNPWNVYLSGLDWDNRNNNKVLKQRAKEEWIMYLEGRKWDFFATLTTRYSLTLKSGRRLIERYFDMIKYPGDIMFYVLEPFELSDSNHLHALWKHPIKNWAEYNHLLKFWQKATGKQHFNIDGRGFDWDKKNWNALNLRKYNPKLGGAAYICNKLTKPGTDYDLLLS